MSAEKSRKPIVALLCCGLLAACGGTPTPEPQPDPEPQVVAPEPVVQAVADPLALFREALADIENNDLTGAERAFERLLAVEEYASLAAFNLGVIAQGRGDLAAAERHYEDALDTDPTLGAALTALVRLRLASGDTDGAELVYQRTLAQSDNAPEVQAAGLLIALHRGNYERVVQDARDVLLRDDDNMDAHYALASAYRGLGQNELALVVLREGIEREPRADLLLLKANIHLEQGSSVAAISTLRQAIEQNPNFVEAHNNLGVLLHRARNE
ncbi:MAG: tetratricopeptide repeat protein, partial [Myxococcales bacterium]|nr:tetratricopeptide repeat protein [Myxococcales bacterium]